MTREDLCLITHPLNKRRDMTFLSQFLLLGAKMKSSWKLYEGNGTY